MCFIAPVVNKLLSPAVQIFHAGKTVSLDKLFLYVIEWPFHLALFPWPVAGAGIELCSQVCSHEKGVWIIPDLIL